MSRVLVASHGGLSKGMKDSVSMIVGDLAQDVETYSLLPGQNPEDFYQEVLKEAKESEEQIVEVARAVKNSGANFLRGGAFKPRTSPYSFQGLELEGLRLLEIAKKETGLNIVT